MSQEVRNFWGWGYESKALDEARRKNLGAMVSAQLGKVELSDISPPQIGDIALRKPRVQPPKSLESICDGSPLERAGHSYGKSFRDVVRGLERDFSNPPDWVAFPRSENDLTAVLDWCGSQGIAAIPYGGGSSVTGGVEPPPEGWPGSVSIDLKHLDKVLEIDRASRAARIQGGIYGPALEAGLKDSGLTLRHFPQSFEFSTLGGWIATRSGGHFATLHTHIEDFVESLRVVTPSGTLATRRLPASGAGPSPERFFAGSEGSLGIITEAWMRLFERPKFRAGTSVKFADYAKAVAVVRELAQSDLYPTNCRLLDAAEAMISGTNFGKDAILLLAFESADHPPEASMKRALEICRAHEGKIPENAAEIRTEGDRSGAAGSWRRTFLEGPYLRDALVRLGMVIDTFETACTWDRFEAFHEGVKKAAQDALASVCGKGLISCRFTHVYPDGVAPYYTVLGLGRPKGRLAQWGEIKTAAAQAIHDLGGTITHHHAVGRDHQPWYEKERDPLFGAALRGAKKVLDPKGILNPGIVVG